MFDRYIAIANGKAITLSYYGPSSKAHFVFKMSILICCSNSLEIISLHFQMTKKTFITDIDL